MIDVIDILKDCKSRYFSRYAGKETLWLLCVIAYHHELVTRYIPEVINTIPGKFFEYVEDFP